MKSNLEVLKINGNLGIQGKKEGGVGILKTSRKVLEVSDGVIDEMHNYRLFN